MREMRVCEMMMIVMERDVVPPPLPQSHWLNRWRLSQAPTGSFGTSEHLELHLLPSQRNFRRLMEADREIDGGVKRS